MSREVYTDDERMAMALRDIATSLERMESLFRNYLRFAVGNAAKVMRAAGPLPPDMEAIVKSFEDYDE